MIEHASHAGDRVESEARVEGESVTWVAKMISPIEDLDGAPELRTHLRLENGHGAVMSAVWHVSALGTFEALVDEEPVADDVLSPGWTSFEWRLRYSTYDITAAARDGALLRIALGNGRYRGRIGHLGDRNIYGSHLAAIGQLHLEYADGHQQLVVTDRSWTAHQSDTLDNDLYDGQTIDARRRESEPTDTRSPVEEMDFDTDVLVPMRSSPMRRQGIVKPVKIWSSPTGATLVDFGQNLSGWIRLRATGERGRDIAIRHAEVLEEGELGVRPLRSAQATDRFILSGAADEFEPTKTLHGFRFAEVTGWQEATGRHLSPDDLEATVVHADLRRTGWFECSDDLLNRLHANIVWSLRGNFTDVPTDCPQRDERLGWTGDAAVFTASAAYLYDVQDFLQDWLTDLAAEQHAAGGVVPWVVPDVLKHTKFREENRRAAAALWSDAAAWVPWDLWQAYGDLRILEDSFPSMEAHLRHVESLLSASGLWDTGFQFGDWLDPDAPPESPFRAKADPGVVATACAYRSAEITAQAAELLGRESGRIRELADRMRAGFQHHYVNDDGTIFSDAPTVYALAIVFGLLDGVQLEQAGNRLRDLTAENDYRISTGFAGTPYITEALASTGHLDAAYRLLMQRESPSWLYQVTMGATTVWERWDSMLPDGSINSGQMTSFNHYALGAIADWMHRSIAGLAPAEPGYRRIRVAPRPGGGLTHASGRLITPHGEVRVAWHLSDSLLHVDVNLPEGVTGFLAPVGGADIEILPGASSYTVTLP